ncbi:MAG: hypothetical protein JWO82_4122, partial [Akkermansiaceae bacterium]|nr:hypothetical protein [Akkermansiaceae bacterium]
HHLSQAIVDMITEQWGKSDLPAATAWVAGLPSSEARENALLQIFTAHAEIDPAATAVLVTQQLPPGAAQEEAAMTVLYHWLRVDEAAAADWVKDFPKGEFRIRAEAEIQGFRSYHSKGSATPP